MVVGAGREGKTALANSIAGRPFTSTPSTVGIEQFSCSINQLGVQGQGLDEGEGRGGGEGQSEGNEGNWRTEDDTGTALERILGLMLAKKERENRLPILTAKTVVPTMHCRFHSTIKFLSS